MWNVMCEISVTVVRCFSYLVELSDSLTVQGGAFGPRMFVDVEERAEAVGEPKGVVEEGDREAEPRRPVPHGLGQIRGEAGGRGAR